MPAERTAMRQVRDVLRLKTAGVAINEIARRVGVASSTVRLTLKRLAAAGLGWPLPPEMTDTALEEQLFTAVGRFFSAISFGKHNPLNSLGQAVFPKVLRPQCRLSDARQPQPRGAATGALDRVLVDFGLKRRTTLLVATYLAVPAALAGSDLVATVPRRVAELIAATARVAVTPLPIDFALTVSMAWYRRAATDPAQSWFRSLLIEAAAA